MPIQPDNLKESNEFLNLVLENINAAVLIVDRHLHIHYYNRSFSDLFDHAIDSPRDLSFGRIAGCINAVREGKECGSTSTCGHCVLRSSLLHTLTANDPVDRKRLERVFYINGNPIRKIFEFSNRVVHFQGQQLVLVIIYDVSELETRKRLLEQQQAIIHRELMTAGEIQKSLLPAVEPTLENLSVAWRFEPSGHLGGDMFQIEEIADGRISIYILDVCGHGVSAAMVAVAISQFLTSLHNRMRLTGKPFNPKAVLRRLDQAFPLDRFDCFFSIAYAMLETESGKMAVANAGHMPPYLIRANGEIQRLEKHGTVIGSGFTTSFDEEVVRLHPEDRLIFYTDGLIENFGPDGERKGKDRFLSALGQHRCLPIGRMVDEVFLQSGLGREGVSPSDDMSLIAVEYTANGKG